MGKKSRRKTGKKAQPETREARRERLHDRIFELYGMPVDKWASKYDDGDATQNPRTFFPGDRVWFNDKRSDGDNPNTYRGMVRGVRDDSSLDIAPFQSIYDGREERWNVRARCVFPDFEDLTLRFELGERVLCSTDQGWVPRRVDYRWPVYETKQRPLTPEAGSGVPVYKCGLAAAPADSDVCIMKHPSSFRFAVGDDVLFDPKKAIAEGRAAKILADADGWCEGRVTKTDIFGRHDYYMCYECSFECKGKSLACYIIKDTDEYIAGRDTEPRERLIEAIKQDCTPYHFAYLASHYSIDVSTFLDMVLERAIAFGSYHALLWLQEDCGVDIWEIHDKYGNNMLHQIAQSDHAARFIRSLNTVSETTEDGDPRLDVVYNYKGRMPMTNELNCENDTWLHILVKMGNTRALDAALSLRGDMAWEIARQRALESDRRLSLMECIRGQADQTMSFIFGTFQSFFTILQQYECICNHPCKHRVDASSPGAERDLLEREEMAPFLGENASLVAKRFVRFVDDWYPKKEVFITIVREGFEHLFKLFYDADPSWYWIGIQCAVNTGIDRNEYIQPELSPAEAPSSPTSTSDIEVLCMIGGESEYKPYPVSLPTKCSYSIEVKSHFLHCDRHQCPSLSAHLEKFLDQNHIEYDSELAAFILFKISLLEDHPSLAGRMEILSHVTPDRPNRSDMDVLMAIRFRQCGLLRWMVASEHVDLDADASTIDGVDKFYFTGHGKQVPSISVGTFLCFACVELDDLSSLQWLCVQHECPEDFCRGLNILHLASLLGRVEIAGWLHSTASWKALANEPCRQKSYEGNFAAHIAARTGHIGLADLLLEFGCKLRDINGKYPEDYAEASSHEFAREWAEERKERRQRRQRRQTGSLESNLERDIDKLRHLLKGKSAEPLKKHITDSKCLDIDTWMACRHQSFDDPGQGHQPLWFGQVVDTCLSFHDATFAEWLCIRLYVWPSDWTRRLFWKDSFATVTGPQVLGYDKLLSFAKDTNDKKLVNLLSHNMAMKLTCPDPAKQTFFSLPSLGTSDLSRRLQTQLLRTNILVKLASDAAFREISSLFINGGHPDKILEIMKLYHGIRTELKKGGLFSTDLLNQQSSLSLVLALVEERESLIEINSSLSGVDNGRDHPLSNQFLFRGALSDSGEQLSRLYIVLVTEGYTELLSFCLGHLKGWTARIEMLTVQMASYLGHAGIVELFLGSDRTFRSSLAQRYESAILGAAEAGHNADLLRLTSERVEAVQDDPIKVHIAAPDTSEEEAETQLAIVLVRTSIAAACVSGYITGSGDKSTVLLLMNKLNYPLSEIMYATELALVESRYGRNERECILRFLDLFQLFDKEFNLQPMHHQRQLKVLSEQVFNYVTQRMRSTKQRSQVEILARTVDWLSVLIKWVDIQDLEFPSFAEQHLKAFHTDVLRLKNEQVRYWSQFDVVKGSSSLHWVQQAVEVGQLTINGWDRGGYSLTHLAAAYDRVDLIEWLVVDKGMDLKSTDRKGRTSLQVAEAAKAQATYKWINEHMAAATISKFVRSNLERTKAIRQQQRLAKCTTTIQSLARGWSTRRIYRGTLLLRVEESHRFHAIWGRTIETLPDPMPDMNGWSSVRADVSDISRTELFDVDDIQEMNEKLDSALAGAVLGSTNADDSGEADADIEVIAPSIELVPGKDTSPDGDPRVQKQWDREFQVTSHVVKFLKSGDPKYRSFFVRRMQQLANGERSRILQKRLKGSQTTIYESYLEQKSGFRILWTEEGSTIVVWFVAKHKYVSRLMKLIDDAKSRSARQTMPQSVMSQLPHNGEQTKWREVLLDIGNVPLKVYDLSFDSLGDVAKASWAPQMHLTKEERDVVEAKGTVLLLGRSGTGKTICICNRIEYDRQRFGHDPTFSQLFVSRSSRLCKYVREAAGVTANAQESFMTFKELIYQLDTTLPQLENKRHFAPSQRIDYYRFQREFFTERRSKGEQLSALVVWKTIRTFLKGSIEAFQAPDKILPRDYFVEGKLGKNRCRIASGEREFVYDIFMEYQSYIQDQSLWDDCDRIVSLLLRFERAKTTDPCAYDKARRSRVYVDEVQDYAQVEILLYFYLGGPGGLFLAGDPAQSVVEGTDFRFEEVRSVGYFVSGEERRDLIPQKPKTVNVNFRSHSGILNTAAAILDHLFTYFPQSAKQLGKDHGLFQGPRPGVCYRVPHKQLATLLRGKLNGVVVLTHDASSHHWRRALEYPLVYGIREAKGLEFRSVIVLDFFGDLPPVLQKPWRDLVLNREDLDFESRHPIVETFLKLLYTAVTRSIEQLYFVETAASIAGDASVRWLATTTTTKRGVQRSSDALATLSNVGNLDSMSMTHDEWIAAGIDNAEMAEAADIDLGNALSLMDRSVYCFEQAQDPELATKARTHRMSVQFRLNLVGNKEASATTGDLATVETKAAQIVESLLMENLHGEALHLLQLITPLVSQYTGMELERNLVSELQSKVA